MLLKIGIILKKIFFSPEKRARMAGVNMGKDNFIAGDFWGSEPYLITIGNHCQITRGVKMHTHGGGGAVRKKYPKFDCFGKIVLGDYVYLGNDVTIMPGVSIGTDVLVAACSVVTKSIPDNVVVGGNPARILCSLDEYIERNMRFNLDSKDLSGADKKELLQSLPEEKFIHKRMMEIESRK